MFVDLGARRLGIGRALVETFERWAVERGAGRVVLEVNEALEPAVRLYERCGYRPTGMSRLLPSDPSVRAVEMGKAVRPPPGRRTSRNA